MTESVLIFLGSFAGLFFGINFLIPNLVNLAKFLGISNFLITFILMSAATSTSELFIGVSSALQKIPSLSFGNILGANFLNIVLVLSVVSLLNRGIKIESRISRKNFWLITGIALLPIFFSLDGTISRMEGFILLIIFLSYIERIIKEKIYFTEILNDFKIKQGIILQFFKQFGWVILGLGIVVVFSNLLVFSANNLAKTLEFNLFSFGVIFVALISTLPEFIFGIRAWMLKHPEMIVGNSLGSIAFNSSFILGGVSLLNPISVLKNTDYFLIAAFLFLSLVLLEIFIYSKNRISTKEGAILLSLYFIFLISRFILS